MDKWKHETERLSAPHQSRVREMSLEKSQQSQCQVPDETRSLFQNGSEKLSQNKTVPLSQYLDALSKQVRENKAVLKLKEEERNELSKLCVRQSKHIHECSQAIIRSSDKLGNNVNLREAFKTKYETAIEMFHKLFSNAKCVTDSLHNVEAVRVRVGPYIKDMKTKSDEMSHCVNETISVTIPCYEKKATSMLEAEQIKVADESANAQKILDSVRQKLSSKKMIKIDQNSKDEPYINELRLKVQEEKQLSEDLSNYLNKTCHEKHEQKVLLEGQVESVEENCKSVENDLVCVSKDCDDNDFQIQSLQIKLSECVKRENQLENVIKQLNQKANDAILLISQEKTDLTDTESKLNCGKDASTRLNSELSQIRKQLSEEKTNGEKELELLADDHLKAKTIFTERRQSLLEDLEAARLDHTELLQEESKLQSYLLKLKSEIESLITNNSTSEQFNSSLANKLTATDCEIQQLSKDVEEKSKSISMEKNTAQVLEDSLSASKQNLEELLTKINDNLTLLAQEEICVVEELKALEREEQQLNHKLQMLHTDMEKSHLRTTEQLNLKLKEAKEQILKLEGGIANENKRKEELLTSFQENLELLNCNLAKADQLIVNLDSSITVKEQNLKSIEIKIKERMEAKMEKEGIVEKYKQDSLKYSENDKEINTKGEEISANLQVLDINLKNIDQTIDELLLVQKDKEMNISSTTEDHKKKEQILVQNYLHYKSTSEYCADEIKLLEKKLISWNDKIRTTQEESKTLMERIESLFSEVQKSKNEVKEVDRELQEHMERKSVLLKEIRLVEEEAAQVQKKHDRIQTKLDAALVAQKKKKKQAALINTSEETSQAPANPAAQGPVTPQFSSIGGGPGDSRKEETPKSILKTPSKAPTPQSTTKRVKFVGDENDIPSSGSTVVMEPDLVKELEANPGDHSNIYKKFAAQQRAAKRKFEASPNSFKIPEQTATQGPILQRKNENSSSAQFEDDDNSSTSTIVMNDYADELAENPHFIHVIAARRAEQRQAKKMKLSNPPAMGHPQQHITPRNEENEISSSTPETERDWLKR